MTRRTFWKVITGVFCGQAVFRPLIDVAPVNACGDAALRGLQITQGMITPETAARLKAHWDASFYGTADDSQLGHVLKDNLDA